MKYRPIAHLVHQEIDGKPCTAVAGMEIVNDDIYLISSYKSDKITKQPISMHKIFNYISGKSLLNCSYSIIHTQNGSTSIAVHANSISYNDHKFYIVTRNGVNNENQVVVCNSSGEILEKLKYSHNDSKIATINHFSDNKFLVSVTGGQNVVYRLVEQNTNKLNDILSFKVRVPKAEYKTGNDSYYNKKTKKLYITKFKEDLTSNAIYVYDLSNIKNGETYKCCEKIYIKPMYGESKFEIEGLSMYKNKIYVCTNSVINGMQCDNICELYS